MSDYEPDNTDVCEGCADNLCDRCGDDCCGPCTNRYYEIDPDDARDRAYAYGWDD